MDTTKPLAFYYPKKYFIRPVICLYKSVPVSTHKLTLTHISTCTQTSLTFIRLLLSLYSLYINKS